MIRPFLLVLAVVLLVTACGVTPTPTRPPATATTMPVRSAPTIAVSVATPIPPTATQVPATATPVAPTASPVPATATATSVPVTATRPPATSTAVAPTATRPAATSTPIPPTATIASSACPQGCAVATPPAGCDIKGNIGDKDEKIYHLRGWNSYAATKIDPAKGEKWFCTPEEARAAGWRAAQQ